ncbi:Uncharacterised protein [uncultured archaeon]|nr:Uncharacterised protein [uncultured archaeon]
MDVLNNLLIFIDGNLERSSNGYLIFSLASAIFGLLVFLLDWSFYIIKNKSLLNLTYDYKVPFLLVAYVIGAGGVGFIGVIINILNFHVMGAIGAGVGWPIILPRIFSSVEAKVDEQKINKEEV